ncbi:hypothetical protein [Butyrivibrio sp. WCD2001]|uniref:hypothetical protein n=1 Tax=Butyrivibrio sp. WCD2001 TaxID=1280681 RepID=UPI000408DB5C|nr:hypothetical protein [Butyrivibrio sp. WCD2001]
MDKQGLDIKIIMREIKSTADDNRHNGRPLKYVQISTASDLESHGFDVLMLKRHIVDAASHYSYKYGSFIGGGFKAGLKKVLSTIIRPAARPYLLDQTEFNSNLIQAVNQIGLSIEYREDAENVEKMERIIDKHEKILSEYNSYGLFGRK